MKSIHLPVTHRTPNRRTCGQSALRHLRAGALVAAVLAAIAVSNPAGAQTDDFNSGTLGPNWATSLCSNFPGTITFPADRFGGKAIRMVANYSSLVTGDPIADDTAQNNPRVIAWRTDRLYTNFYVAIDVLGWNTSIERETNRPLVSLVARVRNLVRDPNVPVGRPDCMVMYLNVNRFGGSPQGTRGVINIGHLKDGGVGSVFDTLGVQGEFTLDPGHAYRMVFTGTNLLDAANNSLYCARVYDLQDLTRPLVTLTCPDPWPGFDPESLWRAPGYSGFGTVADGAVNDAWVFRTTDVTFDNFVAAEYAPSTVSFPGTPNGEAGVPQVVNRSPLSWTNFYPASGGISFTATTLGGGSVDTIKLFLNGADVSSSLAISPLSNSRTVSYPGSGLTSNTVYDARIVLGAGTLWSTNIWTFDTFSDAYLASTNLCKIIECEDFDFGGGQFIDNPLPSGWPTNVTYYNNANSESYPWTGATNQDLNGPPYTSYVNKGTPGDLGVDYWDVDGKTSAKQAYEADFRPLFSPEKSPGTTEGCLTYAVTDYMGYWFPGNSGENKAYVYDTQRKKYYDLDPVNHAIQEYMLERLEGGEWFNYTRTFDGSKKYKVYIRAGAEYTLNMTLLQISPGPATNTLGRFYTTNSLGTCNMRYVPLVDDAGKPVTVNFSGTTKLRLLMDFPQEERSKQGLVLNYMAFVPVASLSVESSAEVSGAYTNESGAVVDENARTVTIPKAPTISRFYRLVWDHAARITSVKVVGENVVLTYE